MKNLPDTVLILSSKASSILSDQVLGTGGWIPPEDREELDWMTFIRFMGWRVLLKSLKDFNDLIIAEQNIKWIILARNPDLFKQDLSDRIMECVRKFPVLLISQAPSSPESVSNFYSSSRTSELFSGQILIINRNNEIIKLDLSVEIKIPVLVLANKERVFAFLDDKPIVSIKEYGFGRLATLSFHTSVARDLSGHFTNMLIKLLTLECPQPVAWYNWENTMILRMDDPGSMETVFNDKYNCSKLTIEEWDILNMQLKKDKGRMTLGYVPAWVDDGNVARGELKIAGENIERKAGSIYPSNLVKYKIKEGNILYDYESEYEGIQKLRNHGCVEVELHGYTHLHPDRLSWASSDDKYTNVLWYREFGKDKLNYLFENPEIEFPLFSGIKALSEIFQTIPSTLICPGDEFTNEVLKQTLSTDIIIVSSYYIAIRIDNQLCWVQHICAPYLDQPESSWFDSAFPVVGYFHDFDIGLNGIEWYLGNIEKWKNAGVKSFIDFREVAGILSNNLSVKFNNGELQLTVIKSMKHDLIRPTPIRIFNPELNYTYEIKIK